MKRILVPTDFSTNAMHAALYAVEIARRSGATLHLAHAPELGEEKIHQPFRLREKYNQLVADDRREALAAFAREVAGAAEDVPILTELLEGPVTDAICGYCTSHDIDLIVMGTKGASGLKEVLVGSVTVQVVAKAKVPVLAVPDSYVYEQPYVMLLATNHFEQDTALVNGLVELARVFAAAIHVIAFMEAEKADANYRSFMALQLHRYLELMNGAYPAESFTGELLEGTDFEAALEKYEMHNKVSIVTMIAYPKGFWDRLLQKSTTRKIALHSRIPILVIPANAGALRAPAQKDGSHEH